MVSLDSLLVLGEFGKPGPSSQSRGMMALWKRPQGLKEETGPALSASACIRVIILECGTCSHYQWSQAGTSPLPPGRPIQAAHGMRSQGATAAAFCSPVALS